jgi:anaerobic magnesium-protoporphyrin IX monomethyl ester cyclase
MMKNVLLINPPESFTNKGTSERLAPPLGLLYLKAMMPNHNVKILDLPIIPNSWTSFLKIFKSENWDAIGITILTYCLESVSQLVNFIRKQGDVYLIGGGAHATVMPDDCLKMGFDAVIIGEGDLVIFDVLREKPRGKILGKMVPNLDEIPFLDRSGLHNTQYGVFGFLRLNGLSTSILTSRGCPFRCSFCSRTIKGSIRRRSVGSVITELESLHKQGFENIFIADDYFITDERWMTAFCRALKKRKIKLNFFYQTRVDTFDKKSAQLLRDIGTQYISFGIESIHPDALRFYNKTRKPSRWKALTENALEACNNTGIYSQASLIIGAPMETEEMFWESYDFVSKHGADTINVNPLTYIVGSDIWQSAVEKGSIAKNEYLVSVSTRQLCPISPERIDEICDEVFQRVINKYPRIMFKTLQNLDMFRFKLLLRGIKEFISWNFLRGNWQKHYNILKDFGYGKKKTRNNKAS